MKALTVQQPHGWALMRGGQNVINWKSSWTHHGPLLVHAGLRYAGQSAYGMVQRLSNVEMPQPGLPGSDPAWAFGAIVGVVDVVGSHRSGDCASNPDSPASAASPTSCTPHRPCGP